MAEGHAAGKIRSFAKGSYCVRHITCDVTLATSRTNSTAFWQDIHNRGISLEAEAIGANVTR